VIDPGQVRSQHHLGDERLRALLHNSADAVVVLDEAGRFLFASPAIERIFGWSPDELIGRSWLDYVVEEDHTQVAASYAVILDQREGQAYRGLFRAKARVGPPVWAEVTTVNHVDNPAVGGVVINVRDVSERLEADRALRASEARFRSMMSAGYDVTAIIDRDAAIKWITPNVTTLLGHDAAALVGTDGFRLIHPDDLDYMRGELALFAAHQGVPSPTTIRMVHRDGHAVDVEMTGTDFLDHADIAGIAISMRDVGDRIAVERDRTRLTEIFEMTSDLVTISTIDGTLVYLNDATRQFVALDPGTPLGDVDISRNCTTATLVRLADEVLPALLDGGIWSGELELLDADRRVIPVLAQVLAHREAGGRIEFVSTVLRDITERKGFEVRLAHEATHDPLTGLPNRTLLIDRLDAALARSRRHRTGVAVLFCDIDHFKVVNDSLGHSFGDRVLLEVARRLQEQLRPGDTVSRFGGDEFVILCEDTSDTDDAVRIAQRVDDAMAQPFLLEDDNEVFVGLSVGIAMADRSSSGHDDPEALIRDADAAMYKAKERGRGRHQVFDHGIYEQAVDRFDLAKGLRHAVDRGELDVQYQPLVALSGPIDGPLAGRVFGVEALVRWDHPSRGRLLPGDFVPVAEETGVVLGMGAWVLHEACRQMARWLDELGDAAPRTLAVNLSARQLEHPELVGVVQRAIAESGLPPERLELEVTESVLMNDVALSSQILGTLKDLGVNISVDDFGTGYSSLSYLRRFPVDQLKVDRSFVDGLGSEPEDSAIVAAIVSLAHTLGLVAVGEGVETADQLEALRGLGCDLAQGYHLARPLSAGDLTSLLLAG